MFSICLLCMIKISIILKNNVRNGVVSMIHDQFMCKSCESCETFPQ